jgi:hypothetical protein
MIGVFQPCQLFYILMGLVPVTNCHGMQKKYVEGITHQLDTFSSFRVFSKVGTPEIATIPKTVRSTIVTHFRMEI